MPRRWRPIVPDSRRWASDSTRTSSCCCCRPRAGAGAGCARHEWRQRIAQLLSARARNRAGLLRGRITIWPTPTKISARPARRCPTPAIRIRVANDALNLDMDVIGFDPFISVDTAWKLSRNVQRALVLDQLLANSDYITIHVPLTKDTKEMFNEKTFSSMKDGVHILNFSRGELVNEQDMAVALENGKVGKYITDFPNENILNMKNTIAIPHLGASTKESEENCAIMASSQVKDFLETGNIRNSVNFPNAFLPYTGRHRVSAYHKNIPNMVGQITSILLQYQLNIADMVNQAEEIMRIQSSILIINLMATFLF